MFLIAHRGNLSGPNPNEENNPEYIKQALNKGYDVEIDVWLIGGKFYLGHDKPQYEINRYFLQNQKLWCHCKSILTYFELINFSNINCFFQNDEEIVTTSRGYLWAHSKCNYWNKKTIITKLDSRNWNPPQDCFAVCSDYLIETAQQYSLPFDLLILDIDGVMTDGKKTYDRDGKVFSKVFCDLDFTAIKRFKAAGINVCFLSGDKIINEQMAKTRKIDFYYNPPGRDKIDMLAEIKNKYNANKIAYVGDDYYDLAFLDHTDLAFCPKNSPKAISGSANIINRASGEGVVAELYDMYDQQIKYSFPLDAIDVNPL